MTVRKDREIIKPLGHRGKKKGKRLLLTKDVLEKKGENPIENLIRLANKAEKVEDYGVASGNWKEIQSYVEAKRKAVDPLEQDARKKQAMTIKELEAIRDQLLEGTSSAITEVEAIDVEYDELPAKHPLL